MEALGVAQGEYVRSPDTDDWLADRANDERLGQTRDEGSSDRHIESWGDCAGFIDARMFMIEMAQPRPRSARVLGKT
jgi:hypothetical protein